MMSCYPHSRRRTRSGAHRVHAAGLLVAAVLVATVLAAPHPGAASTSAAISTAEEIRAEWATLRPAYAGAPYVVAPSTETPYTPGTVRPEFLADGLGIVNFARYLAGVPDDVTLDPARNEDGQYGAVLLAASAFSHTPPKPADMPQAFYDRGLSATSQSNIGWGYSDAESFELGCLDDSDSGNIDRVGHRRWLLHPPMRYTGIGYAASRFTTYAFDRSRAAGFDYDVIAWPPEGYFPVQTFGPAVPWSVTLNPGDYDWDAGGPFTVTLRRVSDGHIWTFDASDDDTAGEYFSADFAGYGIANCFIFRPDPSSVTYRPGDEFDVRLSGAIYAQGTRTPVTPSLRTRFMSLYTDPAEPDDTAGTAKALEPGVPSAGRALGHRADVDWFSFGATNGDRAEFVCAGSGTSALRLQIWDSSGRLVAAFQPGSGTIRWDCARTGRYGAVVSYAGVGPRLEETPYALTLTGVRTPRALTLGTVAGGDRYGTAVATSKAAFPNGAPCVVIATGADWPDALGGAALAAAKGGPILLTRPGSLPSGVAAEIARLGASDAIVLGSEAAVAREVVAALQARLGRAHVRRIGGSDRYATAALAAREVKNALGSAYDGTCFVATGASFPDALGASPLAAAKGWPILLTSPRGLPSATRSAMSAIGARKALILGGEPAVTSGVERSLAACDPERLAGSDRYATAAKVAAFGVDSCGLSWDKVAIATGADFPDALAGAVMQGKDGSVMLLTTSRTLHPAAAAPLRANKTSISTLRFLGGTAALSNTVRMQAEQALY